MTHFRKSVRRVSALAATVSLLLEPSAFLAAAGAGQTSAKPSAPAPTAKPQPPVNQAQPAPASASTPVDGGWPRIYALASGGSVLVYQPQISNWDNQTHLVAFAAMSYSVKATEKPSLGTIKLEADTKVSPEERLVSFQNMKIVEVNLPMVAKEQTREIAAEIDKAIPDEERVIALDRVLANVDKSQIVPRNVEGVKADPPTIFFSKTPAVIVNLDGEPIWSPIMNNDLKYAVNTNWDLFQHATTNKYYLRNDDTWLAANDVTGPWAPAGKLPESFSKLPAEDNWKEVKASLPGRSIKTAPRVFVSQQPAELILLTGEPNYLLVPNTPLLWVSNTDSDVFRLGKTGSVYYLVTGRWFSAPDFTGPWTFASQSLPPEFKRIPVEHERSRVLASVPGTDQAAEAVLLAQIPQTARINKKELKAPEVAFQGEMPQFAPIETTTVQRAVNTDKDVFKVGDLYYMCFQGVWFQSTSPTGPWNVASSVPQEIYKIPISNPAHHVTYVTVEDDDDEWVTVTTAAAYTGVMVAWGCAVWGSGYYYPPYWGYGGFYPYYYPHFPTYGYSAWYNPWTGAYGRSARVYGPYGGAGVGARYNPRTGTYARGAAAYGPYGARGVAQAYNPRTGTYAATRQGSNVYGSWGSTAVRRGDDWAVTNRYTNRRTGETTRTVRTDNGNVYAGQDGNVYRREDGTWQKYDNGGWSNTDRQPTRPTQQGSEGTARTTDRGTIDQLDRDSAARTEGTRRTGDYGSYRGGNTRTTGSYRGGGSMRGGGVRRR